ncbi:Uncharacterized protein GBIM_07193 [Gryllus bimaculatus]|nr:Uncharacterized protein GBIM_07193 [Gryllus bimaculatus]
MLSCCRANVSVSSSSLGRLSKSTSRLVGSVDRASPAHERPVVDYTRSAQTLPRKLYDEHAQTSRLKRQVYQQQLQRNGAHAPSKPHSNSMINVSIINNVTPPPSGSFSKPLTNGVGSAPAGPAKPARTYRTNLSRSKSFNVHAVDPVDTPSFLHGRERESSGLYKSTSHLHRLDESPPPLKSPSILASISRSQRDLSAADSFDKEEPLSSARRRDEPAKISKSTSNLLSNGYSSTTTHDAKKRLFMRELMERAPELYRTLKNNSDDEAEPVRPPRARSPRADAAPSPAGAARLYTSTPLKNGHGHGLVNGNGSHRLLDYSNSFRSSSTNATPPDTRGFRSSLMNGDRVTSPAGSKSSFGSGGGNGVGNGGGPLARRGSSSNDDYSETVRITSKSDDPLRPSVTNTVQSFSKKTVPTKSGLSTETIESTETTTVTKSRYGRGAGDGLRYLENGHAKYASPLRNGGPALNGGAPGGVVIEVRPSRK